jgi:hypothetical protein
MELAKRLRNQRPTWGNRATALQFGTTVQKHPHLLNIKPPPTLGADSTVLTLAPAQSYQRFICYLWVVPYQRN